MVGRKLHACACPNCQREEDAAIKVQHEQMNLLMSTLTEQQRRWYAAIEANRLGYGGGCEVSRIFGVARQTVRRGRRELTEAVEGRWIDEHLRSRSGRKPVREKYPDIEHALDVLLTDELAGDPMGEQMWFRSSLRSLARQLNEKGYAVSHEIVRGLLKDLGYTLRVNVKTRRGAQSPNRDEQFKYIATQRKRFSASNYPIISVDTKKKEYIGDFKRSGRIWCKEPYSVNQYDFTSLATHRAVPYGVYDIRKNLGYVYLGVSRDTPEFSADAIARWWRDEGRHNHPTANELLILADGGGSNGCRSLGWKISIQEKLADKYGLRVTVCHYPTGCSKWNPIEYRLFSHITVNWAGKPLRTLDAMLAYIRGTKTTTGLRVKAALLEGEYLTSRKVTKKELAELALRPHSVCPDWNYTFEPRCL